MRVLSIKARNFRNYRDLNVTAASAVNVIRGKNAQGKTNFIECLFFAIRGFSFRTARENEIIQLGSDGTRIDALVETGHDTVGIQVTLTSSDKRLLLAGQAVGRSELGRRMPVVLFTPGDLQMVKGGPRYRRRFLDLELGWFSPGYYEALRSYRRALYQRNHLLRSGGRGSAGETLDLWTDQLCRHGAEVLAGRLEILKELAPVACRLFHAWAGEELAMRYRSSVVLGAGDRAQTAAGLHQTVMGVRREELRLAGRRPGRTWMTLPFS